jgi:hypothetical protein
MLKRAIRLNLEFIADNKVLENGINRKEYQYLLLKVIGSNQYSIATQFNFSSLKKRIAMMNKLKSAKLHLLKFLFLLPVVVVMLLAFRSKYEKTGIPASKNMQQDTVKLPDAIESINIMESRDKAISSDPLKKKLSGMVLVKRKDGGKEIHNMNKSEELFAFKKKYGVELEDILPAPPTPPTPPASVQLPDYVQKINVSNETATIRLKNGQKENYDLSIPAQEEIYEKKYVEILPSSQTPAVPRVPTVPVIPAPKKN